MLPSVSDAHRLRTLRAVSSFQMRSIRRTLVQPWWNLYQSKVLLLNFLSISTIAAFDKQKSWIKLFEMCLTDFVLFLDHGHSHKKISVERSIFLQQSYTKIRVQNYSYVRHSAAKTWQQRDFITTAMAAEATGQAIVHAKLVDSPLSECSTLHVNDLVDEWKYKSFSWKPD